MSTLFLRTLREDPADAEVPSHRLLLRAGYIRRSSPGVYSWLPLGLRVLAKIEAIVREEMAAIGAQEVHFPALQPREPYEATGRWRDYGPNLFRLKDRKDADYLLAPTHEEAFTLLVKDLYSSYKDLPITLYQIQTKYRDEARPRAGLIRGREFIMKDAYSFDLDREGLEGSYQAQRDAYKRLFDRLGLDYVIVSAHSGAMGGSRSEEFLCPVDIGEDTYVRSAGGYAANVEAVTTPAPDPVPFDDAPAPHVEDTPDAPTIDALVSLANDRYARADRPWTAADTLKNVVLAITPPEGNRELLVIGVPGDRDIDPHRVEAALSPATVEPATEADFAKEAALVPGYIGPEALAAAKIRYLLDPRVAPGTRWITGANVKDKHVFDLVAGRDFTSDGTIDVAEVRAGDPAPDGSGPLELARGVEIGHIFQLGTKYSEALGLSVLDADGKQRTVVMGSYGMGVTRVLAVLAELNNDEHGLIWPVQVAPYHVQVVATGKDEAILIAAEGVAEALTALGVEVCLDDRVGPSAGVKFADAELLGAPFIVVVGRGLATGEVEVKTRATGAVEDVAVADAPAKVAAMVKAALGG
ncbi:MAG: proline--tRNA ligase [Demequinaceae bacterium]|nr:proline--tRNA ligase [Demequinaceae bacterium]